jgi:membrane protease YdiL (CAAX protease family)
MAWHLAAASCGMVLFAACAHHGLPWALLAAAGLLATAIAIGASTGADQARASPDGLAALVGLNRMSAAVPAFALAGAAIGAGAGLWHRSGLGVPVFPQTSIQPFVIVACVIGATEELLYRGWLFGQARAYGWPAAVAIAAVAHAAYKTALFAWPPMPIAVSLPDMMLLTTIGGIVLGLLRTASGSVIPAVIAHVAFDFVVYRAMGSAPWWVWG